MICLCIRINVLFKKKKKKRISNEVRIVLDSAVNLLMVVLIAFIKPCEQVIAYLFSTTLVFVF